MKLFREKKVIGFEEKDVEVYELDVKSVVKLTNGEYKSNEALLADNSNLSLEEIKNLTIEAYELIFDEFMKLNSKYFGEGEKINKKKSTS